MNIIWIIVIGFAVGFIAKLLMPGRDPGGFIITIVLGIVGSFVATYVGQHFGWYRPGQPAGIHRRDPGGHRHPGRLPVDHEALTTTPLRTGRQAQPSDATTT